MPMPEDHTEAETKPEILKDKLSKGGMAMDVGL